MKHEDDEGSDLDEDFHISEDDFDDFTEHDKNSPSLKPLMLVVLALSVLLVLSLTPIVFDCEEWLSSNWDYLSQQTTDDDSAIYRPRTFDDVVK